MVISQTPLFSTILTLDFYIVGSDTATTLASLQGSTSAATEPDNQASTTPPAGVASLLAPIFDLGAIKFNATTVKSGASISPSTLSDATSLSARRMIKPRQRTKCNISDYLFSTILTLHLDPLGSDTATATTVPSSSGGSSAAAVEGTLNTYEVTVDLSQPITSGSSASATTADMAAGHEASQFLPTSSIATGVSQPTLDMGASISAADTPLAAEHGALVLPTTPSDAMVEQKSSSWKKRAKQRRQKAKRNTSDSFIQHCIDFAFRCTGIQRHTCRK